MKTRFRGRASASRRVRERLQTVLNVLDDLIAADWARYRNLAPDWKNLRPRLASDPLLRSDAAGLAEFTAWLFWDGQADLTALWQKLLAQRNKILSQAAGRPIHCSYQVARLFLDIDAYRKVSEGGSPRHAHRPRLLCRASLLSRRRLGQCSVRGHAGVWALARTGLGNDAAGQCRLAAPPFARACACSTPPTCWISPASR